MRDLRQRVVLIHELGQLAGTEEFLHGSRDRLRVNQILRHQAFALCHRETLFHSALNAHQANAELVLGHLTNRTHPTVTEVIDIIDHTLTVADVDQCTHHVDYVFFVKGRRTRLVLAAKAAIELHAAHSRQVIALR